MKILRILCIFSLLPFIGNCGGNNWRQTAKKDLDFIYITLKKNHPGAANPVQAWEPSFNQWLEQGYQEATKALDSVSDYQAYKHLLLDYTRGFFDTHLWVHIKNKKKNSTENWKLSFECAYTGKEVIVTESSDPKIACSDILISVDGVPTKQFLKKIVSRFSINPKIEASLYKTTRFLSLVRIDPCSTHWPIFALAKNYTFKTKNGKLVEYTTQWEKTTEAVSIKRLSEFSLKELKDNCVWVSLPSFHPNNKQEKNLKHIISTIKKYRDSNAIIFDLRNNGGGNSAWGTSIIKALVGKKYFTQKATIISEYWRASKGNLKHLQGYQEIFSTQFPAEHPIHQELKDQVQGIEKAIANNKQFYILTPKKEIVPYSVKSKLNPSTKVFCIVDEYCVSSSLIFIDELKMVTNPVLVGHPTNADTDFMDIRKLDLPSGYGSLFVPMAFLVGRKRKSNECYMPDIHIYDTMQNTQKLQTYMIDEVIKKQ
ncbi:S41 family peptidase [Candidatus Dependentiae bacterium]